MIGFCIPLKREIEGLLPQISNLEKHSLRKREYFTGQIAGKDCVAIQAGHGKIHSAASTQFLIDQFDCEMIFHMGSGGAISPDLEIGDIVVGEEIVEHDYIERFGSGDFKRPRSYSDKSLLNRFREFSKDSNQRVSFGVIVSGNEDVVTTVRRDELLEEYDGLSVDWESCGCAAVCNLENIPVLVLRAMSDFAYEHTNDEYYANANNVNQTLSSFVAKFLRD